MQTYFLKLLLIISFITLTLSAQEKQSSDLTHELNAIKLEIEKIKIIHKYDNNNLKLIEIEKNVKELEHKLHQNSIENNSITKDFEQYNKITNRQDKRIEDINSNLNYWGIGFSLIAILTGLFVFIVNRSYAQSAKKEAILSAEKELRKWISEKADKEFQPKVDNYLIELREESERILNSISEDGKSLNEKIRKDYDLFKNNNPTPEIRKEAYLNAKKVKEKKKEKDFTFNDWYKLFLEKFFEKNYSDSLSIIDSLLKVCTTNKELVSALYFKGIILGFLNKYEKAIEVYDDLIKEFKDSKELTVLELIASAYVNKGVSLFKMKENEKAIEVYDELINEFKNSKEPSILEKVKSARVNKSVVLSRISKNKNDKIY